MLGFWRKQTIRRQLKATGAAVLLILTAMIVWSYDFVLEVTYERNRAYTKEMMAAIRGGIAANADTIGRIMPNIAYNSDVQHFLRSGDPLEKFEYFLKLEKLFVNLKSMKQGILEIVLIGTNGTKYNCLNCEHEIPLRDIPERTTATYLGIHPAPSGVTFQLRTAFTNKHVIYVGVPIYDTEAAAGAKLGYAVMVLDVGAIVPPLDHTSQRIAGSFYVVDRSGNVFASSDEDDVGRPAPGIWERYGPAPASGTYKLDGVTVVVQTEEVPEIGSTIVSLFRTEDLFRGLEDVQTLIVAIFALLAALLVLFYFVISRNILRPLRTFMTNLNEIRAKGWDRRNRRLEVEGYAEFGVMANQFQTLLDEVDGLTEQLVATKTHIYELELLKQRAELQYLKSQINPHFLYNTLETMKGIALARGVREIRDMSDALSRIFRYSIKGGEQVALQEEIDIVEAYISIQRIRFGDRFDARYEFADASRGLRVIKMILQPLVENAIFHGIEPSMRRCGLVVGSRIEEGGETLRMWVQDDGEGIDPETLARIRGELRGGAGGDKAGMRGDVRGAEAGQRHIGLRNVHERIRFAYGPGYGISAVESSPGEGTTVVIRIPAKGDAHV